MKKETILKINKLIAENYRDSLKKRDIVRPEHHKIKCDYLKCFAGMGQAGRGKCFLGGIYWNNNCPEFREDIKVG